jgi:hypothetical protein
MAPSFRHATMARMAIRRKRTRKRGIACQIDADAAVEEEILNCRQDVRQQIGEFLEELQWNPLPAGRKAKTENSFYIQLPCGIFVGWEVIGDLLHIALHGPDENALVRILGIGWESGVT